MGNCRLVLREMYATRVEADAALARLGRAAILRENADRWNVEIQLPSSLPVDDLDCVFCHRSYLKPHERKLFRRLVSGPKRALFLGLKAKLNAEDLVELGRLRCLVEERARPRIFSGGSPGSGRRRAPIVPDEEQGARLPEGRDPDDAWVLGLEGDGDDALDEPLRSPKRGDPIETMDTMLAKPHYLSASDHAWIGKIDRTVVLFDSANEVQMRGEASTGSQ